LRDQYRFSLPVSIVFCRHLNVCTRSDGLVQFHCMNLATFASCYCEQFGQNVTASVHLLIAAVAV